MRHTFGGIWTRNKLEILDDYLRFYVKALQNQPFVLHYVDAFAGMGTHRPKENEGQQAILPMEDLVGSVRVALDVEPGFHHYHFNDLSEDHVRELERIKQEYPGKKIHVTQEDANIFVPHFCEAMSQNDRAVLLVDPYNTEFDWITLKHIAYTGKIDLWLLFPISVVLRMTPKDGVQIRDEWATKLERLLGTSEWKEELYKQKEKPMYLDMFPSKQGALEERVNVSALTDWVRARLSQEFCYVGTPFLLRNNGKPLFLFFLAITNPKHAARELADKMHAHLQRTRGC
jgi:three-Cys-motif partner protein